MTTNLQLQQFQPQQLQSQQQYNPQPHYLQQQPTNLMTTAHFEILKNKLDSLQYELIDLLRHVKDYTQRYMNAVRQQDLDKIDDYINGLFEVDKALKETREKAQQQEESVSEEDTEKCDVTYQPYFFIENWTERFGNAMEEPLASPIYELMQTLKKKEHLDEVRGLLFLGCGMTEKGIDLPIEIHGVDTMELCSGIDYCFFSVKKTMDNLRVLDEIKEAA